MLPWLEARWLGLRSAGLLCAASCRPAQRAHRRASPTLACLPPAKQCRFASWRCPTTRPRGAPASRWATPSWRRGAGGGLGAGGGPRQAGLVQGVCAAALPHHCAPPPLLLKPSSHAAAFFLSFFLFPGSRRWRRGWRRARPRRRACASWALQSRSTVPRWTWPASRWPWCWRCCRATWRRSSALRRAALGCAGLALGCVCQVLLGPGAAAAGAAMAC